MEKNLQRKYSESSVKLDQENEKEKEPEVIDQKALADKILNKDIFMLLDDDTDKILYHYELKDFWDAISDQLKQQHGSKHGEDATTSLQNQENKYEKYQKWLEEQERKNKQNMIGREFEDFDKLAQDMIGEYGVDMDSIHHTIYKKKNLKCCSPCRWPLKKLRRFLVSKTMVQQHPEDMHYSQTAGAMKVFTQVLHGLDLYTDLNFGWQAKLKSDKQKKGEHYHIVFVWTLLATFGPYILQYSTFMKQQFLKGKFQIYQWKNQKCYQKMILILTFTMLGPFFMILLDITQKIEAVGILLTVAFTKKQINRVVPRFFEKFYLKLFSLNMHEIECFETQKKYSQLIFEDFVMITLNLFIFLRILNTKDLLDDMGLNGSQVAQQFGTTIFSIVNASLMLYLEARGLKETFIEYLMRSMRAKLDWIPHHRKIKLRKLKHNVDFNIIEFKIPILSDSIGHYMKKKYEFDSKSLQTLSTYFMLASQKNLEDSNQRRQSIYKKGVDDLKNRQDLNNFIPKTQFGFCLLAVNAHDFLHTIDQVRYFNTERETVKFTFNMKDKYWRRMIKNSRYDQLFPEEPGQPMPTYMTQTVGGKPLLQVCIENQEHTDSGGCHSEWDLKKLMILLLTHVKLDPNVQDIDAKWCLLTFCYKKKNHRAFQLLLEYDQIDPNQVNNEDQSTTFGIMYYEALLKSGYYIEKGFQPDELIFLMQEKVGDRLDRHKPQIKVKATPFLQTPIYHLLKHMKEMDKDVLQILQSKAWKLLNGDKDTFMIQNQSEMFQVIMLAIEEINQNNQLLQSENVMESQLRISREHRIVYFIEKVLIADGKRQEIDKISMFNNFANFFILNDADGNNLMHYTECQFDFDIFWLFTLNKTEDFVRYNIQLLLKNPNKDGITPLEKALQAPPEKQPNFLNKLITHDMISQEQFDQLKSQIMEYVLARVVEQVVEDYEEYDCLINKSMIAKIKEKLGRADCIESEYMPELQSQISRFDNVSALHFMKLEELLGLNITNKEERSSLKQIMENQRLTGQGSKFIIKFLSQTGRYKSLVFQNLNKNSKMDDNQMNESLVQLDQEMKISELDIREAENGQDIEQQEDQESQVKKASKQYYVFETFIQLIIEAISFADVISDMLVLIQLGRASKTIYFAISIFTMLCPYYASYSTVLKFKIDAIVPEIERNEKNEKNQTMSCCSQLVSVIMVLPTMLAVLIVFDIFYMTLSIICLPILILLYLVCKFDRIQQFEEMISVIAQKLFNMSYMDVQGFRLQRTILQVQLESIPQILLQLIIYLQLGKDNDLDIDSAAILSSLIFAVIHVIVELISIYVESKTSGNTFIQYMIACFNGRQNWLPNQDEVTQYNDKVANNQQLKSIKPFDERSEEFCSKAIGFSILFEFSDESIMSLIKILNNFPKIEDKTRRMNLEIGASINHISPEKFMEFIETAYKRVNLYFNEYANIQAIFERDDDYTDNKLILSLDEIRQLYDSQNNEKELDIVTVVQMGYLQVLKAFKELGANLNVQSQKDGARKQYLYEIAYGSKDVPIITYFMDMIHKSHIDNIRLQIKILNGEIEKKGKTKYIQNKAVLESMKKQEVLYNELQISFSSPKCLLDTQCMIPREMQQSLIFKYAKFIKERNIEKRILWDVVFGAYLPTIITKKDDEIMDCVPVFRQWISQYPEQMTIVSLGKQASFSSRFLCMFIGVRRKIILSQKSDLFKTDGILSLTGSLSKSKAIDTDKLWKNYKIDVPERIPISEYHIPLEDLYKTQQIIANEVDSITKKDVKKCDEAICKLGLDKQRRLYFYNSRRLLLANDKGTLVTTKTFKFKADDPELTVDIPPNVMAVKTLLINVKSVNFVRTEPPVPLHQRNHSRGHGSQVEFDNIKELELPLVMKYTYEMNYTKARNYFNLCTIPQEYIIKSVVKSQEIVGQIGKTHVEAPQMHRSIDQIFLVDYSVEQEMNDGHEGDHVPDDSQTERIHEAFTENFVDTEKKVLTLRDIGQKKFIETVLDNLQENSKLTLRIVTEVANKQLPVQISGADIELIFEFYMKIQ